MPMIKCVSGINSVQPTLHSPKARHCMDEARKKTSCVTAKSLAEQNCPTTVRVDVRWDGSATWFICSSSRL